MASFEQEGRHSWHHQVSQSFSISVVCFLWASPIRGFHFMVTWGLLPLLRCDAVGACACSAIRCVPVRHMPGTDATAVARNTRYAAWCRSTSYGHPRSCWKTPPRIYDLGLGKEECAKGKRLLLEEWGMSTTKAKKILSATLLSSAFVCGLTVCVALKFTYWSSNC